MRKDLLQYFQAVAFAYNEWENYLEKDNPHYKSVFSSQIIPRMMGVWELSKERAEEAVNDAISSYSMRNVLASYGKHSLSESIQFLAHRINNG